MKQILRLTSLPLALSVFLLAAHSTGNFSLRDTSRIHIGVR